MTDDEIIFEIRKMLEEEILIEIRAIAAKLDCIQEQMERHHKIMESRLDVILAEQAAYQAERKAQSQREDSANDSESPKRLIH
jgi:hypothetical protein